MRACVLRSTDDFVAMNVWHKELDAGTGIGILASEIQSVAHDARMQVIGTVADFGYARTQY